MTPARKILVDVRETDVLRGFHLLAALHVASEALRNVVLHRVGGEEGAEAIACHAFGFDTGLRLSPWQPSDANDEPFALYALVATGTPSDALTARARASARRGLLASALGGPHAGEPGFVVIPGDDTAAVAGRILQLIS